MNEYQVQCMPVERLNGVLKQAGLLKASYLHMTDSVVCTLRFHDVGPGVVCLATGKAMQVQGRVIALARAVVHAWQLGLVSDPRSTVRPRPRV